MERSTKPKVEPEPEKKEPEVKPEVKQEIIEETAPERQKTKFKKIGGGAFILKGKMIKPGQVFDAFPEDIPPAFRNVVLVLSGENNNWEDTKKAAPSQVTVKAKEVVKPIYKVVPGKSPMWFNIVTEIGKDEKGEPIYKVLNEKGLKKEVAEDLMKKMQG